MRAFAAIDLVADLALGIGDEQAPLRPFHEHDEADQRHREDREAQSSSGLIAPVRADSNAWPIDLGKARHDAGEDDQRDAVADAAAVICSPIHISSIVPPVSVMTAVMRKNKPGLMTTSPQCSRPTAMP